ncbi:nuclear factor NF-kappa-B p100 subunit isoform X3 [Cryptotermes secundus]|nr:nuclear factor NF-kappa-B p100 subunit isoform X3 [Cryptotermes secundus]XP_023718046.1 nuclear factor NF-kappa-B p100 subunit isoform X3 [Cryptotermes secundus]
MMNSSPSPGSYSQSSMDSQDSSSNMSALSPMSVTLSPRSYQNILVLSPEQVGVVSVLPYLRITEEPVEKFRFRYKSEMMGTHDSILGRSSDKNRKKTYPTVQLCNYDGPAIIRCSLYTTHQVKSQRTPHTHRLVVRSDNEDKDDPHELPVSPELGYSVVFAGMGIIHTAKRHIIDELIKKKKLRHLEMLRSRNVNITSLSTRDEINIRAEAEAEAKKMNLNSVCLCFEAFVRENGVMQPICLPVFSSPINNMKSALTGELKICRIDKHVSSCLGNEEVFILVEKVGKKNIKIKFFELDDEDNEVWCDYGKFSELDVHHQYAIVFRTPPYRDTEIDKTVDVFLQLYRPTDGDCSEPIKFAYKPSEKTGRATRKRQRTSLTDCIPVAVVQGHVYGNPVIGQTAAPSPPLANPDCDGQVDLGKFETPPDLFETVLNEDAAVNGMNSNEFKEFIRNLSYSSLGSSYAETFENNEFFLKDGAHTRDVTTMDISTDGSSRLKIKKRATPLSREPGVDTNVATKFSRVSIEDMKEQHRNSTKIEIMMDGEQLAKWAVAKLNETLLEKPPPHVLASKVREIFSKKIDDGDGPLHCAIQYDMKDLLKQMFTVLGKGQHRPIINDRNLKDETPLHLSVILNQPETVKTLLTIGANPNSVNRQGDSPLHLAVSASYNDCISELLNVSNYQWYSNCIDCNLTNYNGCTPLHIAAREKNLDAVKKLVDSGADVNKKDTSLGRTVLHIAVEESSVEISRYLLEKTNIDVNATSYTGNTALHGAVVCEGSESSELCTLLLQYKANPRLENYVVEHDGEVEVCSEMEIKEEPESDDDDDDDDDDCQLKIEEGDHEVGDINSKAHGQTSLDLATDKKDILELLRKVEQPMDQEEVEDMVGVKEEPSESPILEGVLGEVKNGLFDSDTLMRLCDLLDKSQGWVNLADLLDYGFLVASIRNAASPSKMLFNYADLHGNVSVQDIRSFLEALDEHEAVETVDLMLARKIASS